MYTTLEQTIKQIVSHSPIAERQVLLQHLVDFVQEKASAKQAVNLNFICTHNSRRSHLAQIWAQTAADYFHIPEVHCYSGGTEETALFPKIADTLSAQGFHISTLAGGKNPIYAIKHSENALPIIGFSKTYDHEFNPSNSFAAIMTCSQADEGCPYIAGAEKRIALSYNDPKLSDNTTQQTEVYQSRSLEIATEMFYVFSKIKH